MNFSSTEHEVIGLLAAVESLDSMINYQIIGIAGEGLEKEVRFKDSVHQKLFSALLTDFVFEQGSKELTGVSDSCLEMLHAFCQRPSFDDERGWIGYLEAPTSRFREWLDTEVEVETWFPSIDTHIDLKLKRSEFIKICGTTSKHNFTRLTRTARMLSEILRRNDIGLDEVVAIKVLDDFYDRFHENVYLYHCTAMVEMLNNIRWGIHEYLWIEFLRSNSRDPNDRSKYSYSYPAAVGHEFAQSCYRELMNKLRANPFVPRFEANKLFKMRY